MHANSPTLKPVVTRLGTKNQAEISSHFLRLDSTARRSRFGNCVNDGFIDEYAERIFNLDGVVYGVFIAGELRAIAELREILDNWPTTTEAAFSVEPKWQDKGLGNLLVDHIASVARTLGTKSINMICLRDNARMKHLALKQKRLMEFARCGVELKLEYC